MSYSAIVDFSAIEIRRIYRLLEIDSFENLSDKDMREYGVSEHSCEGIWRATFEDGSIMNFDLCSGGNNYWDDITWSNPNGDVDDMIEPDYVFGDVEYTASNKNTYIVHIKEV